MIGYQHFFPVVFCLVAASVPPIYDVGQKHIELQSVPQSLAAREHFAFGMAALHSFEYRSAQATFDTVIALEPSFLLGYWAAALTHWQPIFMTASPDAARKYLHAVPAEAIDSSSTIDMMLFNATRVLFGESSALISNDNVHHFVNAMRRVVELFPEHIEARLWLCVGLFDIISPEDRGFLERGRAVDRELRSHLQYVLRRTPQHPGLLHYLVHINDNPQWAEGAVSYGLQYARSAPQSPHAQHMVTHLLLRGGRFEEAYVSNLASLVVCTARSDLPRDEHSADFYHYTALQLGHTGQAELELEALRQRTLSSAADDSIHIRYAMRLARHRMELEVDSPCDENIRFIGCSECATKGMRLWWDQVVGSQALVCGYNAIKQGDWRTLKVCTDKIDELSLGMLGANGRAMELQLRALEALARQNTSEAAEFAAQAYEAEEAVYPPALMLPLDPIKPSAELAGEVLLAVGAPQVAKNLFGRALAAYPGRLLSLRGMARACNALNDHTCALAHYTAIVTQLQAAENALRAEAEAYVRAPRGWFAAHFQSSSRGSSEVYYVLGLIACLFACFLLWLLRNLRRRIARFMLEANANAAKDRQDRLRGNTQDHSQQHVYQRRRSATIR